MALGLSSHAQSSMPLGPSSLEPRFSMGSTGMDLDGSTRFVSTASRWPKDLYEDIDQEGLQKVASTCLANYGARIEPFIVTGSKGAYYHTACGRKILDWTSGQMCSVLGHGHPELVVTINSHAANLDHISSCMVSPPVIKLASRLTSALPPGLDRAFFLSTGAESNEAAIKLAKRYTGKFEVVGLGESWHGMTPVAQGVQYQAGRKGCGPSLPGQFMLPQPNAYRSRFRTSDGSYDWESELDYGWELIDQSSCGSLAACLVECIQGDAGIHVLPPGYLKALKKHCENRGMLLIVDEAQTGIGRTGDLFAIDHEGVVPHMLTLSKTLGNGLPLSAVVMSAEIDAFGKGNGFLFFTTHVNDPLSASVGDKVLEIVMRCNTLDNTRRRGQDLFEGLHKLKARYGCIGDVRGRGLMAGVEIVSDRESKGPAIELGRELSENMLRRGLWSQLQTQRTGNGVFRIGPPLVSTQDQIRNGLNVMEDAFRSTPGTLPLY